MKYKKIIMILSIFLLFKGEACTRCWEDEFIPEAFANDFEYDFDEEEGGIIINGYKGAGGAVRIPEQIAGIPVTGIDFYIDFGVYSEWEKIEKLIIPDTVRRISRGNNGPAFRNLRRIIFSKNIKSIPLCFCKYCKSLHEMILPDAIEGIGWEAFLGAQSLHYVDFPDNLKIIEEKAFKGTRLQELKLPQELRVIGRGAFSKTPIKKVEIPASVLWIDKEAFKDCTELESVKFLGENIKIGAETFSNCPALSYVQLPPNVIWSEASGTEEDKEVKSLENNAFLGCPKLKSNPAMIQILRDAGYTGEF